MDIKNNLEILANYMPLPAAKIVVQWIAHYNCKFKISKARATKFGDYCNPSPQYPFHRISVNGDLNQYAFLVTTVHEFAHLKTYDTFKGNKIKPHGKEWKFIFKEMMQPFFELKVFPTDIENELLRYLRNPAASSCADKNLYQVLLNYNKNQATYISELAEGSLFAFRKRLFKKGTKRRTRYSCIEVDTQKTYLFSPFAEVEKV